MNNMGAASNHNLIARAFRSADVDPKHMTALLTVKKTFAAAGGWDPIPSASDGLKTVSLWLHDRAEQMEIEQQRRVRIKCNRLERWFNKTGQTPFQIFGDQLYTWLNDPRMSLRYHELIKHLN